MPREETIYGMNVYIKDGTTVNLQKRSDGARCVVHEGNHWGINDIDWSSIKATVGEQLEFIYYYGSSSLGYYESGSPIIKIEYYD